MAETDGILAFAIDGLKRLISRNWVFSETERNRAELQQYKEESNSVLSFIHECCVTDSGSEVPTMEMYSQYRCYCEKCGMTLKEGYPGLTSWQNETKHLAAMHMYSETWLGRRRYLPDIRSDDWGRKSFSERCALNTPIQGTAADIIKMSMGRILAGLQERPWLKPVLQIHDELTFIVPEERLEEAVAFIKQCMDEKPFPEFDLPLVAEASAGRTFGTMEELDE